jgi:dihydrodipicolinate synthase/N-acetylneuraminate lyase
MKTTPVTPADLISSIIALPATARFADGRINADESRKLITWLAAAGVTSFMYGGIGGLFNARLSEYNEILDLMESVAPTPDAWMVPSIGGDFGKAIDQVAMLRDRAFPTAILLPFSLVQPGGVATGIRKLADAYGKPIMVFYKSSDYLRGPDVAALLKDGALCGVEYGIGPAADGSLPDLEELLALTGSADRLIDGAGEISIVRTSKFGIKGYTSGSGLLAPSLSMKLLAAVKRGDRATIEKLSAPFAPFEAARAAYSAIPVVHAAIELAGIAKTGPMQPFWESTFDAPTTADITRVAKELMQADVDLGK